MPYNTSRLTFAMGKKSKTTVTVTWQQAKLILLAKAAEESQDPSLAWTRADSQTASLRTAHALGESATSARILSERARHVLSTLSDRGINTNVGTKAKLPMVFVPILILLAFVLGALTDRVASPEHLVNLLSPPFWSVILWNLGVYVVLILCIVGLFGDSDSRFSLPIRKCMVSFVEKSAFTTLKKGYKATFYANWTQVAAPLIRMHVARTLHWAAVFFALGIIVSLLVRGFGTAYWAGWESTWLSEKPGAVKTFIDMTYGLIPNSLGLAPVPDIETITQWRIDRLPFLSAPVSAAPWLIRMMIIMAALVILPRFVFIVFNTWRMRRYAKKVVLDLDSPYYQDILSQCRQDAKLGSLGIVTSTVDRADRAQRIKLVRNLWGTESESAVLSFDFNNVESIVPKAPESERQTVMLLWLDAIETPEDDVHGVALEKAKAAYAQNLPFAVWLDMVEFAERFANTPNRIQERLTHWQHFIEKHDVKVFVMTDTADKGLGAIKELRTWAAGQNVAVEIRQDSENIDASELTVKDSDVSDQTDTQNNKEKSE